LAIHPFFGYQACLLASLKNERARHCSLPDSVRQNKLISVAPFQQLKPGDSLHDLVSASKRKLGNRTPFWFAFDEMSNCA
jgi:hypothetical protein